MVAVVEFLEHAVQFATQSLADTHTEEVSHLVSSQPE